MFPRSLVSTALLILALATAPARPAAAATPWSWDQDGDRIDDHIQAVENQGLAAAFEGGDPGGRMLIQVEMAGGVPVYGMFVRYDHRPTAADEAALSALGVPFTKRYLYIDYIRTRGTYAQVVQILLLPGVDRVESQPILYPVNDNAGRTMGASGSGGARFPSVTEELGLTGRGVVVAILDSGVNDSPDAVTGYPGHQSLIGKFVGGGNFSNPDPMLNTPLNGSENPFDRGPETPHGSHVAGTAIGSGGPTGVVPGGPYGFYRGMAPDARLVDCKVLTDAGLGGGSPDALEWCIYHKDFDWGLAGADSVYRGIQVVNASIGALLTNSDGTDANCAAFNAAVRAGITCCVSSGNDGEPNFISTPGAADLVITVGAAVDANTPAHDDDLVADFSNEGPRLADADADSADEMKPSICPPGAGITSVNGALTTDGTTYVTINGTSMSSPMAAGLCALIHQACPGITPAEVRRILQDTAEHRKTGGKQAPGAFAGYQAIDPNYHPSWGWGFPDAYAAALEARFPNRTQVVRESAEPVPGGIDVRWTTQREVMLAGFQVLRADPVYGQRGPFRLITPALIPPTGDPLISRDDNRTAYLLADRDSTLVPGETYWYRVRWRDLVGFEHDEPAFPVVYDPPTPVATLHWSITNARIDTDLLVYLGSGTDGSAPFRTAEYFLPAPGAGAADSVVTVPGTAEFGTLRHYWHRTLTDRDLGAAQFLPPSAANPWFLWVNEAGFVNRSGRVESFRVVLHGPGGDQEFAAPNPATPTIETETTVFWIPLDPVTSLNHAPVLDPVGPREAVEGRTLSFTISGSDPDGDALAWSAPELPPGAVFDPGTRTFSWSPDHGAVTATTLFHATFRVADLFANDEERIAIRLHDVDPEGNLPPWWNPANDQSVIRGNSVAFHVSAVDPEGDPLTYSTLGLPLGATFDPVTRLFEWTTGPGNEGDYAITFEVTDGSSAPVTDEVLVTVKTALPPFLGACQNSHESYSGQVGIGAADIGTADRDTVAFSLPVPASRLFAELAWTGGPDLDFVLYDGEGNSVGGGASLANPETFLVDGLPAGDYYFVIEGFTVVAPTDWMLEVDRCLQLSTSAVLSQVNLAVDGAGGSVRLEWAVGPGSGLSGFHVYRAAGRDGDYLRLTPGPVTGDGVYQFVDSNPLEVGGDVAWYRLGGIQASGREEMLGPWSVDLAAVRPPAWRLSASFPNPMAASGTRIRFTLAERAPVRLQVFDVRGALVRTLVDRVLDRGEQETSWDGRDDGGRETAAGLYFYRMEVPGRFVETRRMVRLR